jgi:Ig-like domain from next to BRCA1 gene
MKKSIITLILLALLAAACNLPGNVSPATQNPPEVIFTQAAQTVVAELTRVALFSSPIPPVPSMPTSTFTPIPTNTAVKTPTNTPIPCNLATWDPGNIDVTIPDNTKMAPNQVFSKTWRIRNAGTCSWNSSYLLIFDHGDGLGVTTGYSQQLTSGVVNPGQWVDLTVNNLKAPAANGTYTGFWRLRDPGGEVFGITPLAGTFIVKIVVVAMTTITLAPNVGESGTIRSDAGPFPDYTAGESNADITRTCEAFLSYDITSIPTNATITEVKFDFTAYSTTGNPFGSLGSMNAYSTDYGLTLEPSDFVAGFPPGKIVDWGSTGALNAAMASPELKSTLQLKLGTDRLQLRLQFAGSNGDAVKDRITFTNPSLIVTYTVP